MKIMVFILALLMPFTALAADEKESTFERVMRTGTIRCGYGEWDPIIIKDPNTGAISGIFYDYMEALGKELNLKIEWDSNLTWSDWIIGLKSGRYDAACVGIWPLASRARDVDFTMPIYYHAMYAYVRADDVRFDSNLNAANSETTTFAGMDGTVEQKLVELIFPKAKLSSLPDSAGQSDNFLMVSTKKADIAISDKITAEMFMVNNPGKMKQVGGTQALAHYGNTVGVKIGDDDFRRMIDNATRDLMNRGVIDQILKKYEKYPGSFIGVARPYEVAR